MLRAAKELLLVMEEQRLGGTERAGLAARSLGKSDAESLGEARRHCADYNTETLLREIG
jgi:hypothetical protein